MSYRAMGETALNCPPGQTGIPPLCYAPIENKKCPACTHGIPPYCCPYGQMSAGPGVCVPDITGTTSTPPPEFAYCVKGGTKPAPTSQPQGCPDGQWGTPPFCMPAWGQPGIPTVPSQPVPSQPQSCPEGTWGTPPFCLPSLSIPGQIPVPAIPGPVPPAPPSKKQPLSTATKAALGIGAGVLLIASAVAIAATAKKRPGRVS